MNLDELTRNCFQSGLTAPKWLALCRKLIEDKVSSPHSCDTVETNISNSILALFSSYPGDSGLQAYLKYAIQNGMLSLSTYVTTFLQAARSPDLHIAATLDLLCSVALEAHYDSGMNTIGSITSYSDTPVMILNKIQDAVVLLHTAYTLPISHFHQVTSAASRLLVLLLSCVSDLSQISNTQAAIHYADANGLLMNFQLEPDVRQMLESFVIALSISMGDDVKAAKEAQMIQSIQLSTGKTDVQSSDADVITFSLLFHQWVRHRGHEYGVGSTNDAVAILIAIFRWTAWTPTVFYTQLLTTAIMCLAQNRSTCVLWKAFLVGRLPSLMSAFEATNKGDSATQGDWKSAMVVALGAAFRRPDLIVECDHNLARVNNHSEEDTGRSFTRELLQSLIRHELTDLATASQLDPGITSDHIPRMVIEAQEAGTDFTILMESKIVSDMETADTCKWVARVWREATSHHTFAQVLNERYILYAMNLNADGLSHICKILYTSDYALDILSLHVKLTEIVFRALKFLEEYDCETVGDPQTAVSHLGDVVLLVQYIIVRYRLNPSSITMVDQTMSAVYLFSSTNMLEPGMLMKEEAIALTSWSKALFDTNSEGIEDTILRSTPPRTLLRLSTSLVAQAIRSKLEADVLNNGISYFTSPLLNWTLLNVIRSLLKEVELSRNVNPVLLDVLQTFILSPSCPHPVILLCKDQVHGLLSLKRIKNVTTFNTLAIQDRVNQVTGQSRSGATQSHKVELQTWAELSKEYIHQAITAPSAQKAPSLNVEKCLRVTSPVKFLRYLWAEILVSGSMRETETCKRLATFVLAIPRSPDAPPLLPIFLHLVLPSLISSMEGQQPAEQNANIDILATVISSALTAAAHLDWAVRTASGEHKPVLGQHSPAMVRQLAAELKAQKQSHAGSLFAQKLAASQNFVTNFPFFMTELNT